MRYLLKTQPYEKNIAAGTFRYERDGKPTGVIEKWSLSHALDGYKFFRVDVDGRSLKKDGYSTLYNVVLNPDMQPENVKFRHFTTAPLTAMNGLKLRGQIVFDDDVLFVTREIGDERFENEFEAPVRLNLPIAAHWLAQSEAHDTTGAATSSATGQDWMMLDVSNQFQPGIGAAGREVLASADNGFPTKVRLTNDLTAVSTRLTLYR